MTPLSIGEATIRTAKRSDADAIFGLIRELAEYERLLDKVEGSAEMLSERLFCDSPQVFSLVLELEGDLIGYAIYFFSFSTFLTRHGIWLEDLYVRPDFRGRGYGKALLQALSRTAVEQGCRRVEWAVLDWNQPSIDFYESIGAVRMLDWQICRLHEDSLKNFAAC